MKKIFCFILSFVLILFPMILTLTACNHVPRSDNDEPSVHTADTTPPLTIINPNFSSSFFAIEESAEPLTSEEIKDVVCNLPDDQYESYPGLHIIPTSAELYKDNEIITIDLDDPRLIKLVNFYNNSVYYSQYSYTQGLLSIDYLEENVLSESFRLVLTFDAKSSDDAVFFDTNIQAYDTFIVTNKQQFVLIDHNKTGYKGQEDKYPFRAIGHNPLFHNYAWLDIFEF